LNAVINDLKKREVRHPQNTLLLEYFCLLKLGNHDYYVLRGQYLHVYKKTRNQQVLCAIECPNAKNFYIRFKERYAKHLLHISGNSVIPIAANVTNDNDIIEYIEIINNGKYKYCTNLFI
jgi:hypothetical protein